ncbi:hypothetical protein Ae717Ps2_6858c [Pseudonocardia sp. Ae717_Ps2]|nr:hypothetical protein Ae717Ps2_6858c [Pseudonocardia sp. Ae717_Ps2]
MSNQGPMNFKIDPTSFTMVMVMDLAPKLKFAATPIRSACGTAPRSGCPGHGGVPGVRRPSFRC